MSKQKLVIVMIRILLAIFLIPAMLGMHTFTQFFAHILRRALEVKDLDDVQRILNWRGIKGVIGVAYGDRKFPGRSR